MFVWLTLVLAVLSGIALLQFGSTQGLDIPPELLLSGGAVALLIIVYLATAKSRAHGEGFIRRLVVPAGIGAMVLGALAWGVTNHAPLQSYLATAVHISPENAIEPASGPKAVRIRRNAEGQFVARGGINHSAAEFLVDTGAAVVLLRQTDAEKARHRHIGVNIQRPRRNGEWDNLCGPGANPLIVRRPPSNRRPGSAGRGSWKS